MGRNTGTTKAERQYNQSRADETTGRYPFDLGHEGLREAVAKIHVGVSPAKKDIERLAFWVPTKKNTPVPSPLIGEEPNPKAKPGLAPWCVAACGLNPTEAVNLLCSCMGRQTLSSGIVIGSDLAFWSEAARFAGSLTARQQYLPNIAYDNGRFLARWEPEFSAEDSERLTAMVTNIPLVARALTDMESEQPPDCSAVALLKRCIGSIVDFLARGFVLIGMPIKKATVPPRRVHV